MSSQSKNTTSSVSPYIFLLPLITVLIWAINIVLTRAAIDVIQPFNISFYRWLIAFVVLTPFLLPKVSRERQMIMPYLPKLAVLGLFGMVMYQGLAYVAAHTTTATNMGIINALIPLLTVAVASVVLKEKPTLFAIMGGVVSLLGISILIGKGNPASILSGDIHLGDGLMVLGVFCYACYGVLARLWQIPLSLLSSIYIQIFFGALFQLPLVLYEGFQPINADNAVFVLYAATFPSLIAPLLWLKAIEQVGPNRTSIFMNVLPIFTALIAVSFLNEQWHIYHTFGGVLTLLGVGLAQIKLKQQVAVKSPVVD
jgi:drug/metabolite transporter (DMT)-like permease